MGLCAQGTPVLGGELCVFQATCMRRSANLQYVTANSGVLEAGELKWASDVSALEGGALQSNWGVLG